MSKDKRSRNAGPYLRDLQLLRDRVPSFGRYPFSLPAVRNLRTLEFHPRVTFLVGENGSGKSTLLEALALACDLNPEGGSGNFDFRTRESHSDLIRSVQLARTTRLAYDSFFLRAESFYNVATELERLDKEPAFSPPLTPAYGGRSLHEQSHGESFFAVFENRLRGPGLYLLDEPESALSPTRQMTFLALLHRMCERGSQLVIATHSPIIMAYPHSWIYVLAPEGPTRVDYTETEHYKVSRLFLTRTEKMLAALLDPEADAAPEG